MAGTRPWARFAAVLLVGSALLGMVSAQTGADKALPPVLDKVAPENVEELRALEKHVQSVLKKVMPAVVGVRVGPGQGSGVIVSADGTVLTAGHVSGTPNQTAKIVLPNGDVLNGKTLGRNGTIDSGMIKITKEGTYPFVEMGKSANLKKGQWVIAIGHPGGFRSNRTPVVRVGRILFANRFLIRTDCTLVGGDSGGPLFDMQGRVIGIHSRIGGAAITENIHVPIDTYRETYERLAKGESWGGKLGQTPVVRSAGGKKVFEKKDQLTAADPKDSVQRDSYSKRYTFPMKAGSTYTIDLVSGDKTGKKLDAFLRLEDPQGKKLADDDDGGGFPHSRIVHKALKAGDYRIVVTSFEPGQTGPFTLTIHEADFKDSFVAGKVEVLKAIKIPPPALGQLVDKFKQAKVPLFLNAVIVNDQGVPLAGKEITFEWTDGKETVKSNKEGVVRWPLLKEKAKKLSLLIPNGLRAMLALTDQNGNDVGLKFGKDDIGAEKTKSAGGMIVKTFDGKLAKGNSFDYEREKCFRQVHELKMQPGKTYTIDLTSDDFDAYLRLEDNEKNKLAEDDDGAGYLNSRIVFTPSSAGTYRLVVTTCDPGQTGSYRLTVRATGAKTASEKK